MFGCVLPPPTALQAQARNRTPAYHVRPQQKQKSQISCQAGFWLCLPCLLKTFQLWRSPWILHVSPFSPPAGHCYYLDMSCDIMCRVINSQHLLRSPKERVLYLDPFVCLLLPLPPKMKVVMFSPLSVYLLGSR